MDPLSMIRTTGKRILVAVSHPGEEARDFGGLIDRYSKYAALVGLIVMTKGEASALPATTRQEESRQAIKLIGVSQSYFWSYKAGTLAAGDQNEMTQRVTQIIRLLIPQVVITYAPGSAPDADNNALAKVVAAAVPAAADDRRYVEQLEKGLPIHQADKLYYLTSPAPPHDPEQQADWYPPTTVLNVARNLEAQRAAWCAHRSLSAGTADFEQQISTLEGKVYLHLAVGKPGRRPGEPFESDLFGGLNTLPQG